jgi:integrase
MDSHSRLDLLAEQHGLSLDKELIAKAREVLQNVLAPVTVINYNNRLREFGQWCRRHNRCAFPADKATVTAFFLSRISHYTARTMELHRTAIKMRHLRAGFTDPTTSDIITAKIDERRRVLGDPRRTVLYLEDLIAVVEAIGSSRLADLRDRALLLATYLAPLRVGDIHDLKREHVIFRPDDMLLLLSNHRVVSIPRVRGNWPCPVAAMYVYLKTARIRSGPIFVSCAVDRPRSTIPLHRLAVGRIVRRCCKAAGLPDSQRYIPTSLHSGFIVSGLEADVRITDLMVRTNLSEASIRGYNRFRRRQHATSLTAYMGL